MTVRAGVLALTALACAGCATAAGAPAGTVRLDPAGSPVFAHWKPVPDVQGARPAIVALHGCGGLYRRDGKTFDVRYPLYIDRLHRAGYHVLLPDSFTPRGLASICTVKSNERTITVEARRADVAAAVRWLAQQPGVDAQRIVLLGWSHGAITTLNALNTARAGFAAPVAAAVVFYPGCKTLLKAPFKVDVPVLMLLAEKDDWTPSEPCVQFAQRTRRAQPGADFTLRVYAGSYHGFDGTAPLRYWTDVSNGVDPKGVHLGANPVARAEAHAEMDAFLMRVLK